MTAQGSSTAARLRTRAGFAACCLPGVALAFCLFSMPVRAQEQQILCADGEGHFEASFGSGITVAAGAVRKGGFAAHACTATINWKKQSLEVTPAAAQVDIDILGADLGLGVPVVAMEIRKADKDRAAAYRIYSLARPPRLLRTITGGDIYRAADADLDGRVAIWTDDIAAADGFDGLAWEDFDFPPVVALRFERNRLVDASAEYPFDYDARISRLRSEMDAEALAAFRNSDGHLMDAAMPPQQLARLRRAKVHVLELVWLLLYSGREQKAWSELAADWPAADQARIRNAIAAARTAGIDAQVDAVAPAPEHPRERQHAEVYETERTSTSLRFQPQQIHFDTVVDLLPRPILITRRNWPSGEETLDVVLDAAGKVWSAKSEIPDAELIEATRGWRFIPAFKDGRPVACKYRIAVSPYR